MRISFTRIRTGLTLLRYGLGVLIAISNQVIQNNCSKKLKIVMVESANEYNNNVEFNSSNKNDLYDNT